MTNAPIVGLWCSHTRNKYPSLQRLAGKRKCPAVELLDCRRLSSCDESRSHSCLLVAVKSSTIAVLEPAFASLMTTLVPITTSDLSSTRVLNPRRLQLPSSEELERGTGRSEFLGVTFRQDRQTTRPWVARYLNRTVGNYKSALDAGIARWICSRYDRDIVEEDGVWCGQAYQGKDTQHLVITRFTGATEECVVQQIEDHLSEATTINHRQESGVHKLTVAPPPPANPRRETSLPQQLPRTAGRGQYRGVIESKGRYVARWNNTLHLGSYRTAFEAGLAVYIAEHYDRDIEANDQGKFSGRAYKKPANGKYSLQHFYADTEIELTRLIDEFHGITNRAVEDVLPAVIAELPLALDQAIRQFWDEIWRFYGSHNGYACCAELYLVWQLFLGDHGFAHLVDVKERVWCGAVDRVMVVKRFNLPYESKEQALDLPSECRLPVRQSTERVLWKLQWEMDMTATCSPEVCMAVWDRRRMLSLYRGVRFRQSVSQDEIHERKMLQERFPEWVDDWERPPLLTDTELCAAEKIEVDEVDMQKLRDWCAREPDNLTFRHEYMHRLHGGTRDGRLTKRQAMAAMTSPKVDC